MQDLFKLIGKFGFVFLFIILEIISLVLVVRRNNYQRVIFNNATAEITGTFFTAFSNISDYFKLSAENKLLAEENSRLRAEVAYSKSKFYSSSEFKSIPEQAFSYVPCKVINNSLRNNKNYFTIDAGKRDGIETDMAIISPNGIAGVVRNVSDRFAVCMSVLNTSLPVSAQVKKTKDYGSLEWDGKSATYSYLKYIPTHVPIVKGDTIETSMYSSIFPEGIPVGVIENFTVNPDDGYYVIKIRLTTNFHALRYVYAVKYNFIKEQKSLEDSVKVKDQANEL
jgi:rod shape-determining protein MreC